MGDPAALQALAEQVARDSLIPIEEFFIPDITQPDPIEALKELLAYSDWMVFNNPTKDLARIHTMDASPARTSEERVVDRLEDPDLRAVTPAPLVSEFFEIVSFSELPATEGMISTFPSEAVAIAYLSSSDGYEIIRESTGEVLESIPPWTDLPIYVVIAPTAVGWQEYWYGS